jgi:heme exporter protein B
MSFFRTAMLVFVKDLKIEIRSKEIITSVALFALLVVLLCAFGFGLGTLPSASTSAGVLWIAVAFSGTLVISRTYLREREFNVFRALILSPQPRAAIYLGKMLGVTVFLLIVVLLLMPMIELFFHAPMLARLHLLLPIILLAIIGYAAVGTLFGAMTVRTRLRDILLGAILYPLIAPTLITAVQATEVVLRGDGLLAARDYLQLLAVIDIIYVIGSLWLFGPLMED